MALYLSWLLVVAAGHPDYHFHFWALHLVSFLTACLWRLDPHPSVRLPLEFLNVFGFNEFDVGVQKQYVAALATVVVGGQDIRAADLVPARVRLKQQDDIRPGRSPQFCHVLVEGVIARALACAFAEEALRAHLATLNQ